MKIEHRAFAGALSLLACLSLGFAACSSDSSDGTGGHGASGGSAGVAGASGSGGGAGSSGAAGSGGAAGSCTPNATESCDCTNASEIGARRCAADGSGWSSCDCTSYGAEIAVSPSGDDAAAGTLAAPFRSLARAKQKVSERVAAGLPASGVVVWLREGVYELSASLSLGATESGSDGKPVVWRGYPGESARVVGGVRIDPSVASPITASSPIYSRLDPPAQAAVLTLSLSSAGISDIGALSRRGFCGAAAQGPLELFVGGEAMRLARWPDKSANDPGTINHGFASIAEAPSDQAFRYSGNRPERWQDPANVWFHGFWKYAWADCHVRAASIDTGSKTVTLADSAGYGVSADQPYYAYNIPEELSEPGEYWIDPTTQTLYLWPPAGFSNAEVIVSVLDKPLVELSDASYVTLRDFTLEAGRGQLVRIQGGVHDELIGLTLRNAGTGAGSISGTDHRVRSCHVYGSGNGGFIVSGGDRSSLTPGNVRVENSHFHHLSRWEWTYRPAVVLSGAGNRAEHNSMHDLPHSAILYGGNDHVIELNDIGHVCQFSSDAGAIYSGRDWGARGNVIRHNFVHHLSTWFEGYGVQGIYLDDCLSGVRVEGNVLYEITGYGIQHGGGRDDVMINNVMVHSGGALTADRRCATWLSNGTPNDTPGDSWNLLEKLQKVGYQNEPWASKWPECAAIPNDWNAIASPPSHWLEPEGSVFSRNVGWDNAKFAAGSPETFAAYAEQSDNLENVDPGFVNESALDLTLSPSSPALGIPGFAPIPFSEIGIQP